MADPQPPEPTQPGPGPFERWYRVTTSFVGREAELATLAADLDATADGRGGVVLVAGEPGIGKTRLAEELAAQATTRGALVLWGRCWEGEGAPAFWPWIQIVRGYVETADPAALRQDMGAGAADIAQWFPPSASACLSCRRRHRSSRRRPGSGCSTAWPGSCGGGRPAAGSPWRSCSGA
jgi:AAA ATPase domain